MSKKIKYTKLDIFLSKFLKKRSTTPTERVCIRLGYIGTGFFIAAPHLLPSQVGIIMYILAGLVSLPQVLFYKQWNIVLVDLNVILAYLILLFSK